MTEASPLQSRAEHLSVLIEQCDLLDRVAMRIYYQIETQGRNAVDPTVHEFYTAYLQWFHECLLLLPRGFKRRFSLEYDQPETFSIKAFMKEAERRGRFASPRDEKKGRLDKIFQNIGVAWQSPYQTAFGPHLRNQKEILMETEAKYRADSKTDLNSSARVIDQFLKRLHPSVSIDSVESR